MLNPFRNRTDYEIASLPNAPALALSIPHRNLLTAHQGLILGLRHFESESACALSTGQSVFPPNPPPDRFWRFYRLGIARFFVVRREGEK